MELLPKKFSRAYIPYDRHYQNGCGPQYAERPIQNGAAITR